MTEDAKRILDEVCATSHLSSRRHPREGMEQSPPRERKLDTSPIDWQVVIDNRLAEQKQYLMDVLIELTAQLTARMEKERSAERQEFTNKLAALELEIANLKVALAECNLALAKAGRDPNKANALILPSSYSNGSGNGGK
jgi:hypothetical protein